MNWPAPEDVIGLTRENWQYICRECLIVDFYISGDGGKTWYRVDA